VIIYEKSLIEINKRLRHDETPNYVKSDVAVMAEMIVKDDDDDTDAVLIIEDFVKYLNLRDHGFKTEDEKKEYALLMFVCVSIGAKVI
jgi:hypothetical protein